MTSEPGEVRDPRGGRSERRLDEPPSARYAASADASGAGRPSPMAPLAQAVIVAIVGAALLFLVGAVVASTAGLVFVCGVMGAGIGLSLSKTSASRDAEPPALSRGAMLRLSILIALGAVVVADVATWLYALREGGTLGLLDYLLETFGPFVPGELIVAAFGAAWGAGSGPITRS